MTGLSRQIPKQRDNRCATPWLKLMGQLKYIII
jgi:hypothetical protein